MRYRNNRKDSERGFIALMSTVVISAILIVIMASVGRSSFYARFDSLRTYEKRSAEALAESCMNVALLALATSSDPAHYSPTNQKVFIGLDAQRRPLDCVIKDVIHAGTRATIDAYASSYSSYDTVSTAVSLSPSIQISSWGESP